MKITEITEGWGEYSNKSNHRMNKFKREDTDEGFRDAWSTAKNSAVGRGIGAVAGAAGRAIQRGGAAAGAKMGMGKYQGVQQVQRAVMGVYKNFQRYLGQSGLEPTAANLQTYLKALGIENPVMREAPEQGSLLGDEPGQAPEPKQPKSANLNKNDIFKILTTNIQIGLKNGTLPKELKKFLGQ